MAERIGIFKGRSATYNKLILQVLTEALSKGECLKEWELAKRIQKKMDKGNNWYAEAQKIYSVLIRKNGRLNELKNKWYIKCEVKEENGRKVRYWLPTLKGIVTALLLNPNLIDGVVNSPIWKNKEFKEGLINKAKKFRKTLQKGPVPIKVAAKPLKKLLFQFINEFFRNKQRLEQLIKDTEYLINQGFQLDLMDEISMLQITPTIKEMQKKLINHLKT